MKWLNYKFGNGAFLKMPWSESNEKIAAKEAVGGCYTVDDGDEMTVSHFDKVEAQVTYTAMMTDTLLEV